MSRVLALLLAFVSCAHAADYTVTAEHGNWYTRNVTPASAVRSNTTFAARAMVPSGPVIYTAREVIYSPSTVGKLIRFAASPAGVLTITAASAFMEWWASQDGHVRTPQGELLMSPETGTCNGSTSFRFNQYGCDSGWTPDVTQAVSFGRSCLASDFELRSVRLQNTIIVGTVRNVWNSAVFDVQVGEVSGGSCRPSTGESEPWDVRTGGKPPASWKPFILPSNTVGEPSPVSDEHLADDLASSPYGSNDDVLRDLFNDANGRPWNTSEIDAIRRAIRDELASQDGTDPATLPDVPAGTSADPSNPGAPETQPSGYSSVPPGGGGASGKTEVTKLPDFCTWATGVCDWLGWTQEPLDPVTDAPDLPVVESAPATWDSGLGGGACPAPIVVSALGASVSLSWQPACDFVSMLRPILIAFAGIAAALILLGQRAGGAG